MRPSEFTSRLLRAGVGLCGLALLMPLGTQAQIIPLQNATADHSFVPFYPPSAAIDGVTTGDRGWALNSGGSPATVVFETQADSGFVGGSSLTFTLYQGTSLDSFLNYQLGRFRLSVTTDDRSTFADGLANGGDVTANWTVLNPLSFSAANGATMTKLGDSSLLAGAVLGTKDTTYTVVAHSSLTGITGFRIETLLDASLPGNGPGHALGAPGNFELQEFEVRIAPVPVPEPGGFGLVAALGLVGLAGWRQLSRSRLK